MSDRLILIEGIPGSGKSTLARRLSQALCATAYNEGEKHPCDLAWHAVLTAKEWQALLARYPDKKDALYAQADIGAEAVVLAYVPLGLPQETFHWLEQHEVFDGKKSVAALEQLVFPRWRAFAQNMHGTHIFECAFLQNYVNELLLFHCASTEEILEFETRLLACMGQVPVEMIYLQQPSVRQTLENVRAERVDETGAQVWAQGVSDYIAVSPYGKAHGLSGWEGMVAYFEARQKVERALLEKLPIRVRIVDNRDHDGTLRELTRQLCAK